MTRKHEEASVLPVTERAHASNRSRHEGTWPTYRSSRAVLLACALGALAVGAPVFAGPYVPIPNPIPPRPGPEVPPPSVVPGKEYSHELDRSSTHAGTVLDAQQNTMWDGSGGIADTFDYDGNNDPTGEQVDAIANHEDALFFPAVENRTTLLYSQRSGPNIQGQGVDVGPPVWFETPGGSRGGWASWAQVDQNGGQNLDGLEVWGPEGEDDANMFSLFGDARLGTSVYSYSGGVPNPYISHQELAAVVNAFYAGLGWDLVAANVIDLDALMVQDLVGDWNVWNDGDSIMFSLWPTASGNTTVVGDGVYVWQRGVGVDWLNHGGHPWSEGWLGTNVDALEAVPAPASLALVGLGMAGLGLARRRRVPAPCRPMMPLNC